MIFYIGYDRREDIVYRVAKATLLATTPGACVVPLVQDSLRAHGIYTRPRDERASTDFSLTRFLVPYLAQNSGWVVFVDCDFLFTRDVTKNLEKWLDDSKAIMVVKHNYEPKTNTKMANNIQYPYPRKNWSSFIAWNLGHEANASLDASVVNSADPSWLHQFQWLDEAEIGELPIDFNFLVGEYEPLDRDCTTLIKPTDMTPTCLHYTLGIGPFVPPVQDYAALWEEKRKSLSREITEPMRGIH